jgi:sugar phosphate isomerase/epimerase
MTPVLGPLEVGIFSRTWQRASLDEVLDAAAGHGFRALHFNFASAGLQSLPDLIDPDACDSIRAAFAARGMVMAGVSGTYNTIHPDRYRRAYETERARRLILAAPRLGTGFVSLSTGTRDPDDMWRAHPRNGHPAAWRDLTSTLEVLVRAADEADVVLGIEPEHRNVVATARHAARLLDEMRTPRLRIILDAANLVAETPPERQRHIFAEAFDLLAPNVAVLHAKDAVLDGNHVAAGRGFVDYPHLFELVGRHRLGVPVIIHDAPEDDVARVREFIDGLAAPVRAQLVTAG